MKEQKHYGSWYKHVGMTPELVPYATESTFAGVIDIEKAICEHMRKLTLTMLRHHPEDITDTEELETLSLDHIKARRALSPGRSRAIEFVYRRKGDETPRRKSCVELHWLPSAIRRGFERLAEKIEATYPEFMQDSEPKLRTLESFVYHWMAEWKCVVDELSARAGLPAPLPPHIVFVDSPAFTASDILKDCRAYNEKYHAIDLPAPVEVLATRLTETAETRRFCIAFCVEYHLPAMNACHLYDAIVKARKELAAKAQAQAQQRAALPLLAGILV